MIDIHELEFGSLSDRVRLTYELDKKDVSKNPDILRILRKNLEENDDDLLEISILRLGVRFIDVDSTESILRILKKSKSVLVRLSSIISLSALYEVILKSDRFRAQNILSEISEMNLSDVELKAFNKFF
ncbi:hypothetical protein ACFFF7_13395 [Novosphingobium aquiterrae]|uniref:HEAT repeat domain-containing protein n=1 Tax=Novosphingobium aquiterrae TaxID=624388 RepID=A0ABV6PKN8_9SPHN